MRAIQNLVKKAHAKKLSVWDQTGLTRDASVNFAVHPAVHPYNLIQIFNNSRQNPSTAIQGTSTQCSPSESSFIFTEGGNLPFKMVSSRNQGPRLAVQ